MNFKLQILNENNLSHSSVVFYCQEKVVPLGGLDKENKTVEYNRDMCVCLKCKVIILL